ncbi:HEPN domain protein [uncultured archaeon]|nr:HEPN domain protein [uncultured archaeon]
MKNIDDCFLRGLLRKVEPSRTKSEQSLLQARDWLYEARKNLDAEAYRSALSSAYLAIFHSARAVLFRDGIREKSHDCVGLSIFEAKAFTVVGFAKKRIDI